MTLGTRRSKDASKTAFLISKISADWRVARAALAFVGSLQTEDELESGQTIHRNARGFSQLDAKRGTEMRARIVARQPVSEPECEDLAVKYSGQVTEFAAKDEFDAVLAGVGVAGDDGAETSSESSDRDPDSVTTSDGHFQLKRKRSGGLRGFVVPDDYTDTEEPDEKEAERCPEIVAHRVTTEGRLELRVRTASGQGFWESFEQANTAPDGPEKLDAYLRGHGFVV